MGKIAKNLKSYHWLGWLLGLLSLITLLHFSFLPLPYEPPKIVGLIIFVSFFSLIEISRLLFRPTPLPQLHRWAWFFFFVMLVVSLLGVDFTHSLWGSCYRRQGLFVFFFLLIYFEIARRWISWHTFIPWWLVGVVTALHSIFQWWQLGFYWGAGGVFGQKGFLAGFLVSASVIGWGLLVQLPSVLKFIAVGQLIIFLGLFTTTALDGYLAVLVSLIIAASIAYIKRKITRSHIIFLGLLVTFSVIAIGFIGLFSEGLIQPAAWSAEARPAIWRSTWNLISDSPVIGYGVENLQLVFGTEAHPVIGTQDLAVDRAHNLIFDLLVWGGIWLLAAFVIFLILNIRQSISQPSFSRQPWWWVSIGIVIAFLVRSLFNPLSIVEWLLLFTSLAYLNPAPSSSPSPSILRRIPPWSKFTLIILTLLLLFITILKPLSWLTAPCP